MKKILGILIGVLTISTVMAQNVVAWNYSAKKISDKVYELHIKATIQNGWHLYSQYQSENFIGNPTTIKFNKNPLLSFAGVPAELGSLKKVTEPTLGTESAQYASEVEFVQKVELKTPVGANSKEVSVKTNIGGSISFQVCTNEKCLPPATVSFSVPIE